MGNAGFAGALSMYGLAQREKLVNFVSETSRIC